MKWELEAELALKAVSKAGALLNDTVAQNIVEKDTYKDIVTEYDLAAGKLIEDVLKSSSKYPIINEEAIGSHELDTNNDIPYWVVDPIDGTTNFSSGMPFFASSVGLVCKKEFVVGAVYAPKTKDLYFTYGDQGSYLNGKIINCKKLTSLKQASVVASFSNGAGDAAKRIRQYEAFGEINDKSRTLLRLGSAALNIAYVCDGKLHGAYGLNAKIWDVGASLAIAKQAGCTIYCEFLDSLNVNYIVGSEIVVSEIKSVLLKKGLLNEPK